MLLGCSGLRGSHSQPTRANYADSALLHMPRLLLTAIPQEGAPLPTPQTAVALTLLSYPSSAPSLALLTEPGDPGS